MGCAWREWVKTRLNSKYPLSCLRSELSSVKHKTDAAVFLRIFLWDILLWLQKETKRSQHSKYYKSDIKQCAL